MANEESPPPLLDPSLGAGAHKIERRVSTLYEDHVAAGALTDSRTWIQLDPSSWRVSQWHPGDVTAATKVGNLILVTYTHNDTGSVYCTNKYADACVLEKPGLKPCGTSLDSLIVTYPREGGHVLAGIDKNMRVHEEAYKDVGEVVVSPKRYAFPVLLGKKWRVRDSKNEYMGGSGYDTIDRLALSQDGALSFSGVLFPAARTQDAEPMFVPKQQDIVWDSLDGKEPGTLTLHDPQEVKWFMHEGVPYVSCILGMENTVFVGSKQVYTRPVYSIRNPFSAIHIEGLNLSDGKWVVALYKGGFPGVRKGFTETIDFTEALKDTPTT